MGISSRPATDEKGVSSTGGLGPKSVSLSYVTPFLVAAGAARVAAPPSPLLERARGEVFLRGCGAGTAGGAETGGAGEATAFFLRVRT